METIKRELKPVFDNAKSFYGKAYELAYFENNLVYKKELYSYNTLVLTLMDGVYKLNEEVPEDLLFSNTTLRHLKDFLKQHYYNHKHEIKTKKDIIKYNNVNYYKLNKEEF